MLNAIIVEDEALIRTGLKMMMDWEVLGIHPPKLFSNGLEALEEIRNNHPDLAIVDIRMPGFTGLELIQKAKELQCNTRFVILSGHNEFEYAKEAVSLGVFRYLLKPVSPEEFYEVLSELVQEIKEQYTQREIMEKYKSILGDLYTSSSIYQPQEEEAQEPASPIKDERVAQVLYYIHHHLEEDLTLEVLAKQVYIHPNYLSHIFKSETGENLVDYITRIRIEYAKRLLSAGKYSVLEVAQKTGYGDARYFSKVFKKNTGILPSDWSASHKQGKRKDEKK